MEPSATTEPASGALKFGMIFKSTNAISRDYRAHADGSLFDPCGYCALDSQRRPENCPFAPGMSLLYSIAGDEATRRRGRDQYSIHPT